MIVKARCQNVRLNIDIVQLLFTYQFGGQENQILANIDKTAAGEFKAGQEWEIEFRRRK